MIYRHLRKDELIQEGDEVDRSADGWRDDPIWDRVSDSEIGTTVPDPRFPAHRIFRRPIGTVARLHNNGLDVRVDLGNTGENWPNCTERQIGFPWMSFGKCAFIAAEEYARQRGATEIIYSGPKRE